MDPARPHDPDELFEHADFLRRLARDVIGDEHRADDLVQDAYVAALEHPPHDRSALGGWLGRVVQNRALNVRRGDSRRADREERSSGVERQEPPDESLARMEVQKVVFDLVLALPRAQRTALYLRYYEGLTPTAIADRIGAPVKTVKTRLSRGLAALRERLDERADGDRSTWLTALAPIAFPPAGSGTPVHPGGPSAAAGAGILGGLAVKKLVVGAAALVAAAAVWLVVSGTAAGPAEADVAAAEPATLSAPSSPTKVSTSEAAPTLEPLGAERDALEADETSSPVLGGVTLHLLWHDGQPAVGVAASLQCRDDPNPRRRTLRVKTTAEGVAVFDDVPPGGTSLWVDRGHIRFDVSVVAGEATEVVWQLPEGIEVRGTVLDAEGEPVSDAEVWLEGHRQSWPDGVRVVDTAADGSFELTGFGEGARISARAAGFQPSPWLQVSNLPAGAVGFRKAELWLGEPGGGIGGRVLDPDGEPVAGALVQAGQRGEHIVKGRTGVRGAAATPAPVETDADGAFTLPGGHPAMRLPIHALAEGFPVWSGMVDAPASGAAQIEIRLEHPAVVEGTVIDSEGRPVPNATLLCARQRNGGWYEHPFPPIRVTTDESGRYRMGLVPPGAQEVNVSAGKSRLGRAQATVICSPGRTTELDLTLDPNPIIAGRVTDSSGRPLVGWLVHGAPAGSHYGRWHPRQDKTDGSGAFVLTNVGDLPHELSVSGPGRRVAAKVGAGAGERDVAIVVEELEPRTGLVSGVLRAADGSVPVGAWFTIHSEQDPGRGAFLEFDEETGAFHHGPVEVGRYRLRISLGGGSRTALVTELFQVDAGVTTDVGELRIEPGGRVEVLPGGFPIEELELVGLKLNRSGSGTEDLELEGDRLVSRELMPGTWVLSGRERELYVYQEIEVVSGRTEIAEVEIQRAFRLELDLHFADDDWDDVEIVASDDEGARLERQLWSYVYFNAPPAEVVFHLPAGHALVEARTNTGLAASAEVTLGATAAPAGLLTLHLE